ncbi:MAG: insulinase family protein [Candidatus Omnitrophota bacterium]|nr:MAG: insulinase family protein [Candidatus Omnitrophota bacterium]
MRKYANFSFVLIITFLLLIVPALANSHAKITKEVLENGLTVLIKEERSHPLVTIQVTVDAGLSSEGVYGGTGISHFIEHMIFKGTPTRKPGDIEKEVKSYGGEINGWTGLDSAGYSITIPKEYAREALLLMEDVIFRPAFDTAELEKERQVILKEIKLNRDDPTRRVMKELWQASFLEHPYKLPLIGYETLFKELKRDDLINYHSLHYTPNNMILAVAGDIDKDKILNNIKSGFGKYKRKRALPAAVPLEPQQNSLRESKGFAQINLGYIAMAYHTVELSSNDLYALDVLGIILGDWDGSRLNKRLVKDNQLLYTVSSFNYTPKYPGLFIIYGVGDYEKLEGAKAQILREIAKIRVDGIEKSELDAAKNIVISSYINSLETTAGMVKAISQSEFLAGDPAFFEKYVENVKKIDEEAITRVAKKYLGENNLTVSYLCPAGDAAVGERPVPVEPAKGPQRVELSNGIRLILKEDRRIPKVSLVYAFLGGVRAETEKNNGISNLTSAMLLKGTKKRKEGQIKAFMESRGGQISHFSGKNSFGVSLDFLSGNIYDALDILEDVIENPSFPEEELKKEKEKLYAAIKAEDDDVYSTGFLKLKKALFGSYPYGLRLIGQVDSLKGISRKDIKDFYKKFSAPNNMVISVVGDFEPQKMRREIEKRFSDIDKIPFKLKTVKLPALVGINEVEHDMPREQSLILVGFRGSTLKSRDRFYLEVLSSVLSGENGRLYQSIRNELGLSYALGTFSAPGVDSGFFASYVATDQAHLREARNILLKELREAGAISEEEIKLAKKALIGRHKIALQSYKALAYKMALDELYGIGYNAYEDYAQSVSDVTRAEVVKASKKYIDLENFALVAISGEE